MVSLDVVSLNTQHYKVRIKGKVEQSRERSTVHLGVVAKKKRAFGLPSTTVANFTYIYIYINELNYRDQKIQRTLARDIRKHWTAFSTSLNRTCDHRMQSQNSNTEASIHIAQKWRQTI